MLSCTWNGSEAPLPAVPRHPNPGGFSLGPLRRSRAEGTVPGLSVGANNSEEELAPAGAADPGQPGSPPTAQKQLKVAHRGHCEE